MIRAQDLEEAIAECEGEKNPNANTCIKLAAFYTIREELYGSGRTPAPAYSYETRTEIPYSNSPFSQAVEAAGIEKAFPIIEELMEVLYVQNRPLYEAIMAKIE